MTDKQIHIHKYGQLHIIIIIILQVTQGVS
jgi:hypothetical protein